METYFGNLLWKLMMETDDCPIESLSDVEGWCLLISSTRRLAPQSRINNQTVIREFLILLLMIFADETVTRRTGNLV